MAVIPADHHVGKPDELRTVLAAAASAAVATNALITLGILPSRPETGFGYLALGTMMGTWGERSFRMVERFVEKPSKEVAERFLRGKQHLWNAGMFVFTVDAIKDAIRTHSPQTGEAMEELQRTPRKVSKWWNRMEATSVDYGIMERSHHILTVPCDLDWSDVGTWGNVEAHMPVVEGGHGVAKDVVSIRSRGCVVRAPKHVVALVGVENLVVVEHEDAILVMNRDSAQSVPEVVAALQERELNEII